jgi:hypothetical protein
MKKISIMFGAAMASLIIISSCKKESVPPPKPSVSITAPTEFQMYNGGDTVFIKGDISHVVELHEIAVEVKPKGADTNYFAFEKHIHIKDYHIDTFFVNHVAADNGMTLTISAQDHDGNQNSKSVSIHCMK